MMEKFIISNFKNEFIFWKKIIIRFVNAETGPRLLESEMDPYCTQYKKLLTHTASFSRHLIIYVGGKRIIIFFQKMNNYFFSKWKCLQIRTHNSFNVLPGWIGWWVFSFCNFGDVAQVAIIPRDLVPVAMIRQKI
jgi:hypothetical protein